MRLLLRHDHFCNCSDCAMQNGIAMDAKLAADPRETVSRARAHVAEDRFAYGLLLRTEMELSNKPQYPAKMLPQSQTFTDWQQMDLFTRRYA